MGCASSKIDDLPAVTLCRHRLDYLNQSLHLRYSLSDCHVSYLHSLSSVSSSLHRFLDPSTAVHVTLPPPSPSSPPPKPASASAAPPPAAVADSGHIDFHSDSDSDSHHHIHDDDDTGSDGSLHHDHDDESEDNIHDAAIHDHHLHHNQPRVMMYGGGDSGIGPPNGFDPYSNPYTNPYPGPTGGGGGYMHMNYMRKHVTPSVSYQQKPLTSEPIHYNDPSSSSSSSYANPYYPQPNYGANYGYMDYGPGPGAGGGGFFGGPPRGVEGGWGVGPGVASTSKPAPAPPPPPPPPSTSAWDFLNPFESIEANYPPYTPSRDSREVREEEGIPDLEDEDYDHEVVKEVHGHQKLVDDTINHHHNYHNQNNARKSDVSDRRKSDVSDRRSDAKRVEEVQDEDGVGPSVSPEGTPVEYEVHMVDKKVVGDKAESQGKGKHGGGFRNVFEAVRELQLQFERAAAAGAEVGKVLEVGKLRYHRKNTAYQVSSKMLTVITPSLPSSSKDSEASLDPDEDVQLRSVNLSASLQKLYLWEKKLFEEVKAEEKMRVLHDRKLQKLKHLAERGAEESKIEPTRSLVRSLSTKIGMAIQVVDKISIKINNVRDDELWPQLKLLIQGLSRMWNAMLECHHSQCQAIDGARGLDAIAFPRDPSDSQLEASLQLEHDLINWTYRFTEWIGAQKDFVRALNNWLLKCIFIEREVTADGEAPFSPGRAGAPPIFVICYQWNESLERISETSEKEVVDSMRVFAKMVWHFRERDKGELRQRMTANRDVERKVKNLEREDMKMQKEKQALDKKMVLHSGGSDGLSLSGDVVYQSDTSNNTSLQAGLLHIFEALDRFAADSVKAYEELLQRTEEVVRERERVH